jgi:hypothetical protein
MNREHMLPLWAAYHAAFRHFACQACVLQAIAKAGLQDAMVDAALADTEKARIIYGRARDTLAAALLPADQAIPLQGFSADMEVRKLAEVLWELHGRPNGTAEIDWARAERLVRRAAA